MAATGDAMTIVGILRQAPYLSNALRAAGKGKRAERMAPYIPWRDAPMLMPLGSARASRPATCPCRHRWPMRAPCAASATR
ncbi:hypothetical protein FIU89_05035 [Roseovarius sp. THAF27]|uniref:hypothetical protein n=1 Tax=Roseovarius sp. THAF27 TaxID=2587850 RepID=UPI00126800F2|nr:hypothetical protein [Roseovarius sp. THAF27]QFT79969.1 hypothetical protein FIU89_05035 [Roseovarius sp. THAF27]